MRRVYAMATQADSEQIKDLWRLSFSGDSDEDIALFCARFIDYGFVTRVGGWVASMLFLLPAEVVYGDVRMPVGYIYAGATHPDYRQNGLYRDLIRFVLSYARKTGLKAVFLRPADEKLAQSYRRMGFTVPMTCREYTVSRAEVPVGRDYEPPSYRLERRKRLNKTALPYVDWDECVLAYALTWCRAFGNDNGVGLYTDDGRVPVFWEWLGEEPPVADGRTATVRTVGTEKTVGLLCPFDDTIFAAMPPIYMGYGLE